MYRRQVCVQFWDQVQRVGKKTEESKIPYLVTDLDLLSQNDDFYS